MLLSDFLPFTVGKIYTINIYIRGQYIYLKA